MGGAQISGIAHSSESLIEEDAGVGDLSREQGVGEAMERGQRRLRVAILSRHGERSVRVRHFGC